MKLLTLFGLAAILLSYSTTAQETATPTGTNTSKFAIGAHGAASQVISGHDEYFIDHSVSREKNIGGGIFIRYYLNEHFAIEGSATGSFSRPKYYEGPEDYFVAPDFKIIGGTVRGFSYEVPVQAQYHFFRRNAKLRPYLGAGIGVLGRNYDIERTIEYYETGKVETINSKGGQGMTFYAQVTQGLTYRLCDKLQLNESFYYQQDAFTKGQNIGLTLGVGYLF